MRVQLDIGSRYRVGREKCFESYYDYEMSDEEQKLVYSFAVLLSASAAVAALLCVHGPRGCAS